jgi:hypothetical protein
MTEAEWLGCTDPTLMFQFLQERASDRKLRLFALACCRRIFHLLGDERARAWFGQSVSDKDVAAKTDSSGAQAILDSLLNDGWKLEDFQFRLLYGAARAASGEEVIRSGGASPEWNEAFARERNEQASLMREYFGNPFRPLPPRPEDIAPLADEIYAGRWELMPLLGEWLQEHGFWTEGEHCLDPSVKHVKGCHVVDWVTGRE